MSIDVVNDSTPRVQYTALAAQTDFDYPFPIFVDADLVVDLDGTTQTLDTDYTVTGAGADTGGTVTLVVAATGGEIVTVYRDMAIERITDFQQNGEFSSQSFNDELDRITLVQQELKAGIGRALRFSPVAETTDAEAELSPASNWYEKFMYFNASGVPEPATGVTGSVLSQSTVGAALYPQTSAEASAGVTPTYYYYPPGDVRRYGADPTGAVDSTQAFTDALAVVGAQTANGAGGNGVIDVPAGIFSITTLTIPESDFIGIRGAGMYNTILQISTASTTGLTLKSRATYENFMVIGLGDTEGQTGISLSASHVTVRNVKVRDCETGWLLEDCFVGRFYEATAQYCENGIVFNSPSDIGFGSGTYHCQDNAFFGGSFSYCTYAIRMNGTRRASFQNTNVEQCSYGITFEGRTVIGNRFEGLWIENCFYSIYVNLTVDAGVSFNNTFENCYVAAFGASDWLPAGKTLADARYIYLESMTAGLRNTVFRNNFFTTVSGSTTTTAIESVAVVDLQYTIMDGNFWSVTGTSGDFSAIQAHNNDTLWLNVGSFTGTLTGCTTSPTGTISYTLNEDLVTLEFPGISGTSNTTAATITGMPAECVPTDVQACIGITTDNGANTISRINISAGGTITLYNGTSATFTGSGTKGVAACTITYRTS